MFNLVPRREVLKQLHIHYQTLRNMVLRKDIQTVHLGNKYLYNLNKYLSDNHIDKIDNISTKINICYCRVSSSKQSEDLQRQIKYMKYKYPHYRIISEIGSGMNYKRNGLRKIIDLAILGQINELVVTYKDRLLRFGYEIIEYIISEYSNGKIIIINKTEEQTPTEEVVTDIISIMNVFVAKINGLRKYKNRIINDVTEHKY
jgi:predicted site-specific integrase-resolvase